MARECQIVAAVLVKWLGAIAVAAAPAAAGHGLGDDPAGAVDRSGRQLVERWSDHIEAASLRFGIPETWIRRVMRAESGGRTMLGGRPITSSAGAMGLMQLMPATWQEMRARYALGSDPHHPRDNILAGTAYLRNLYDEFGHPGLFAAYHAGPARYAGHLAGRRLLPAETIAYVTRIGGGSTRPFAELRKPSPIIGQSRPGPLFVTLNRGGEGSPAAAASPGVAASGGPSSLLALRSMTARPPRMMNGGEAR